MGRFLKRRRVIGAAASGLGAGIAGCLGGNESEGGEDSHEHDHNHDHNDDGGSDTAADDDVDPALRLDGTALSEAFPIELVEPDVDPFEGFAAGEQRVANVHWHGEDLSHWHHQPLRIPLGGTRRVRTRFVDRNERELPVGPAESYHQSVRTTAGTADELTSITVEGAHVTFTGDAAGTGGVAFRLHDSEDDTVAWTSPDLEIAVGE